jgi:endonuclease-3
MARKIAEETPARTRARLKEILAILGATFPDARLELDYSTPLELLVALILAAQSRDVLVNEITAGLFARHRTAADWANADLTELESAVRRINGGRIKAAGIRNASRALVERFGGNVPERLDDLLSLPRVGRKTANVLLGNAFGHDVLGVDTHVARLSQRLGFTRETEPDEIESALMAIVPRGQRVHFTHLMQLHGRRICIARKPKCPECPVNGLCPYPLKTPPELAKAKPRGAAKPSVLARPRVKSS